MSASSNPTRAPESCSEAARLTAIVDLPTPPLPEPTAITCFTPGIAASCPRPLKAARTLAVIFRSTAVTPGIPATRSRASDWNRSRTGQAGVVSSNVKPTRPPSVIVTSLIMPRLTTSRPRSGSLIADSTVRTSSLLGTENHRGTQGQDSQQDQDGDHDRVETHSRNGARSSRGLHPHMAPRFDQRSGDAGHGDGPQRKPWHLAGESPSGPDRDEEHDDQRQLQHREVAVRLVQPAQAEAGVWSIADEEGEERRRAAQSRGKKKSAEHPGVAPHRLVADTQQHSGVRGDEDRDHSTQDVEWAIEDHRDDAGASPIAQPRVESRDSHEESEHHQGPHADRHGRPVLEVETGVARSHVDHHVPELPPADAEVGREQDRTDHRRGKAHQERDARRRLVARIPRESQQRPEHISAGRQPRKEKVEEDVPGPLWGLNEVLGEE